jgi:hypothetical protein
MWSRIRHSIARRLLKGSAALPFIAVIGNGSTFDPLFP